MSRDSRKVGGLELEPADDARDPRTEPWLRNRRRKRRGRSQLVTAEPSGTDALAVSNRAPFACAYVCLDCSRLADSRPERCPACGAQRSYADLGHDETALALLPDQHGAIDRRGSWVAVATGFTFVAIAALLPDSVWGEGSVFLLVAPLLALGGALLGVAIPRLVAKWRPSIATRWRLPRKPGSSASPRRTVSGRVELPPGGALLCSPFTGEQALAYYLVVESDRSEGRPKRLLVESRSAKLIITPEPDARAVIPSEEGLMASDGAPTEALEVTPDRGVLKSQALPVDPRSSGEKQRKIAARFLRSRGYFPLGMGYRFSQAMLHPGTAVVAEVYDDHVTIEPQPIKLAPE